MVTPPFVFASTFHLGYSISQRSESGSVFAADVDLTSTPALIRPLLPTPSAVAAGVRATSGVVFVFASANKLETLDAHRTTPATIYELGLPPLEAAFRAAKPPLMETSGSYKDSRGRIWLYTVTPGKAADGKVLLFHQIQNHKAVYLPNAVLVLTAPEDEIIANATHVRNDALIVCGVLLLAMIPTRVLVFAAHISTAQSSAQRRARLAQSRLQRATLAERIHNGSRRIRRDVRNDAHAYPRTQRCCDALRPAAISGAARPPRPAEVLQLGDHREAR